jgi:PAS domain S-box-containing protein
MMKSRNTSWLVPVLLFTLTTLLLAAAGWQYSVRGKRHVREAAAAELESIAELKSDLIANWRTERLGDALVLMQTPFNDLRVIPYLENPVSSKEAEADIRQWMEIRLSAYGYLDAILVDARGDVRLSIGSSKAAIGLHAGMVIDRIRNSGKAEISDFHVAGPFPGPHLDLYVPITGRPRKEQEPRCAGVLVLRIDPGRFLNPVIDSMNSSGASAEAILARRDANGFLVLNELLHRKDTVLKLRDPFPKLAAGTGIIEGPDYRGVPVLAAVSSIPDSPWFLIVKRDLAEIYAPYRMRMITQAAMLLGFAISVGLVLLFLLKRKEAHYFRREFEAEHDRLALLRHFEYLQKYANDIILLADKGYRIVDANERACEAYGFSREELLKKSMRDLRPPEEMAALEDTLREAEKRGGLIFETFHQRRDGCVFPVEVSLRIMDIEGDRYHQTIIRDITQHRADSAALKRSEAKYKILFEMAHDAIFLMENDSFTDCNAKTLEMFGGGREDIIGRTPGDFSPSKQPDGTDSRDKSRELIHQALSGSPQNFEWKHRRLDGTEIDTEISLARTDIGGRPLLQAIVRDVTERKKAELRIKEALREKDVLLREIHHRVKNNMQVISSLLSLQAQKFRDKDVTEAFRESQGRIRSMALVHEKLYQTRDLSHIDFSDYVQSLTASLFRAYQVNPEKVKLKMDLDKVRLDINTSIPCGLILNEIVLNSLKHAFPGDRKGEICVELREKKEGLIRLTVKDDGVGFPPGIDIRNTDTLGLQIVTLLTDQLDGKVEVRSEGGTAVTLTFLAKQYKPRI